MHHVVSKTFGGLSKQYYFRQFMFSLLFPAITIFMVSQQGGEKAVPVEAYLFFIVNSILYPYSRFVYESVANFIIGNNQFYVNAITMLIVKYFTMAFCWALAIIIAPIGLAYLYYHHSKAER